jgi:hypothetical protein
MTIQYLLQKLDSIWLFIIAMKNLSLLHKKKHENILVVSIFICICCFSAKHAVLKRKSKDWLARNQDNVSEWGDMSIRGMLFQ